ncbi:MAG: alcohol dehydrogenase family protein [Hyphomicrobiaceae bacterium]
MNLPEQMSGMVLTGHGGLDRLVWRDDLPTPVAGSGEVLVKVHASSVNNTDINTRTAWYSKSVRGDTASGARDGNANVDASDGSWSGKPLDFPLIQGADCCGEIVAVGADVDVERIGERVLVRALQSAEMPDGSFQTITFGSEHDGGFAQYAKARSYDALQVNSAWSATELASIPCAYSTAEGMLQRASVQAERVLITGASGGVGSAAVQLAKRRGAHITAMTSRDKADAVRAIGADEIVGRDDALGVNAFDAVVDLVAGPRWPEMIAALRHRGRYVTAGAIAGPIVELDVRDLYLRDLTFYGSTYQPDNILPDVIGYIERGELRPLIAEEFALEDLAAAQEAFISKSHIGKIALRVA